MALGIFGLFQPLVCMYCIFAKDSIQAPPFWNQSKACMAGGNCHLHSCTCVKFEVWALMHAVHFQPLFNSTMHAAWIASIVWVAHIVANTASHAALGVHLISHAFHPGGHPSLQWVPSQHPQLGPMWVPAGDAGIELGMGYPRWVPCGLFMGCPYMGFTRVYPHGSHMGCMWVSHGGLAHMGPIWDECGLL